MSPRMPSIPGLVIHTVFDGALSDLLPEEQAILPTPVSPLRERQFVWGRLAAQQCLRELGFEGSPVKKGEHREPLWPEGIVGSISHTNTRGGAACAHLRDFRTLGYDLQEVREISSNVLLRIASEGERCWIEEREEDAKFRANLLFSVKESIYKALFPLCRKYIGFAEAEVLSVSADGEIVVAISSALARECSTGERLSLRYSFGDGTISTLLTIPS